MNVPHRLFIVGVAKVRSVRAKNLAILVHSFLARVLLLNDLPSLHLFLLTRHVTILITVLLIFKYFEKLSVILLIRHFSLSLLPSFPFQLLNQLFLEFLSINPQELFLLFFQELKKLLH